MRVRSLNLVSVALLCAGLSLCQETTPKAKVFEFGATMDETYKVFGPPQKWFVFESGRHLNTIDEFRAASQVYRAIADVYMRETPNNLYEIRVSWRPDTTSSRLRPTPKLYRLEVEVDKPGPPAALLKDFPEAAVICKSGCDLYGVPDIMGNYILAYPSTPTAEQTQMGAMLATDFKPNEAKEQWCVAIKLKLERGDMFDRKAPSWDGKIVSMDIGTESLRYALEKSDSISRTKTTKIGTWLP